ncbi:hypothetical protein KC669_01070 [Candidatus Dojkabacteria bacterium]|uniref:DUF5671 domain-containing protein n=1 Tax=Candidatus Dojkabacteria bacterium TaxID=2099670 RepID=A0A955L9N9_9BACT|nr:hypothetical protein [Candidatus Dojkabacteria bacterium]
MNLFGSGIADSFQSSVQLSMLNSFATSFITIMLYVAAFALIFYYITGENKRADKYMPKFLSHALRGLAYVGLYSASFGLVASAYKILMYVFTNLFTDLPKSVDKYDGFMLLEAIVLLIFFGIFAYLVRMGKMRLDKWVKENGEMSTKLFVAFGMLTYAFTASTAFFVFLINFLKYIDDSKIGLDVNTLAVLLATLPALAFFAKRSMEVLKQEGKK